MPPAAEAEGRAAAGRRRRGRAGGLPTAVRRTSAGPLRGWLGRRRWGSLARPTTCSGGSRAAAGPRAGPRGGMGGRGPLLGARCHWHNLTTAMSFSCTASPTSMTRWRCARGIGAESTAAARAARGRSTQATSRRANVSGKRGFPVPSSALASSSMSTTSCNNGKPLWVPPGAGSPSLQGGCTAEGAEEEAPECRRASCAATHPHKASSAP